MSSYFHDAPYIRQAEREGMPDGWSIEDSNGCEITASDEFYFEDNGKILCKECLWECIEEWWRFNPKQLAEDIGFTVKEVEREMRERNDD